MLRRHLVSTWQTAQMSHHLSDSQADPRFGEPAFPAATESTPRRHPGGRRSGRREAGSVAAAGAARVSGGGRVQRRGGSRQLAADPDAFALILLDLCSPGNISGRGPAHIAIGDPVLAIIPTIVVTASELDARERARTAARCTDRETVPVRRSPGPRQTLCRVRARAHRGGNNFVIGLV